MNHSDYISKVGLFGILGNLLLMLLKFLAGILFVSQAMISDAVNSLMDIFSSLMTFLGGKISDRPKDQDHPFGHGKAEFLFSLFISLSMIASSLFLFLRSFNSIWNRNEVSFSWLLVLVCFITIMVKLYLYFYAKKIYQNSKNLLVYANMLDHRNDIIITFFTLLSVIFLYFHISLFDSCVGIGISLWILYSGIKIFIESYHILMDRAMNEEEALRLQAFILKQKGVLGITKFETAPTGNQYLLVLSILVDGNLTTFQSHKIADRVKRKIIKQFPEILTATIHVNPFIENKQKEEN